MAVKIRLKRIGSKKNVFYRIVVADARSPRDGRFIENVGTYDPQQNDEEKVSLKEDRIKYWLSNGAQPTDTVSQIIKDKGIQ